MNDSRSSCIAGVYPNRDEICVGRPMASVDSPGAELARGLTPPPLFVNLQICEIAKRALDGCCRR